MRVIRHELPELVYAEIVQLHIGVLKEYRTCIPEMAELREHRGIRKDWARKPPQYSASCVCSSEEIQQQRHLGNEMPTLS
jgi:predicted SprT family Zn-dependent metalloprotease